MYVCVHLHLIEINILFYHLNSVFVLFVFKLNVFIHSIILHPIVWTYWIFSFGCLFYVSLLQMFDFVVFSRNFFISFVFLYFQSAPTKFSPQYQFFCLLAIFLNLFWIACGDDHHQVLCVCVSMCFLQILKFYFSKCLFQLTSKINIVCLFVCDSPSKYHFFASLSFFEISK